MSEPEHHLHRTDMEWRAIIRGWRERLMKANEDELDRFRFVNVLLDMMEKESK